MKHKIITAKYIGYNGNMYEFELSNGTPIKMYGFEVCTLVEVHGKLPQIMNRKIGKEFKILLYYDDVGYYVMAVKTYIKDKRTRQSIPRIEYRIYNSINNDFTGIVFNNISEVPNTLGGMPISRVRKKAVIHEL